MTRPGEFQPEDAGPDRGAATPPDPAAADSLPGSHVPGSHVRGESVLGETAPCGCPWETGLSTYLDGWLAGQAYGYEQGHADGLDAIRPAAEALAALRPSRHPTREELQRVRAAQAERSGPARTPEQIRARASASWQQTDPDQHTPDPHTPDQHSPDPHGPVLRAAVGGGTARSRAPTHGRGTHADADSAG